MNKTKNSKKKNTIKNNSTANKAKKYQKKVIKDNKINNTPKKNNLMDDKKYKEAEKLFKEKKYEECYEIYIELNNKYKKNKKIYKRLLESLTHNYTYKENKKEFKKIYNDYLTTYKLLINKKELKYLDKKIEEYKDIKVNNNSSKFLLIAIFGWTGIHKFLEKKYILGIIYLLTFGIFGIGIIVDLINDYAEYENDRDLNICRYILSIIVIAFAIYKRNTFNIIFLIIIGIIITPIIYDKLLKKVPNFIKILIIIFFCFLGFRTKEVVEFIPVNILGTWKTDNENTNFKEIIIKNNKSIIKFNDRKEETGINEYNSDDEILKVYVNATTFYKFKIDKKNNKICNYNESNSCLIAFTK